MQGTLLTADEVWGDNALEVMKDKECRRVSLSDLAVLLGGGQKEPSRFLDLENRLCGYFWTSSVDGEYAFGDMVRVVHDDGGETFVGCGARAVTIRPVLRTTETSKIESKYIREGQKYRDAETVFYGYFPQTVAQNQARLERLYQNNELKKTGKVYRFDSVSERNFDRPYRLRECEEYAYGGERFIRIKSQVHGYYNRLSTGKRPRQGWFYWVKVEPVEWLKDKSGVWVTKEALLSGMQFDRNASFLEYFENTEMYQRVQEFVREIMPDDGYKNEKSLIDDETTEKFEKWESVSNISNADGGIEEKIAKMKVPVNYRSR